MKKSQLFFDFAILCVILYTMVNELNNILYYSCERLNVLLVIPDHLTGIIMNMHNVQICQKRINTRFLEMILNHINTVIM
jgi:hypothetical protein